MDFIATIEAVLGKKARRNLLPMQKGDVPATWADCALLQRLTGYQPKTSLHDGMTLVVDWYRSYYSV
jgi:UDP-glucuronate 4-epimerase